MLLNFCVALLSWLFPSERQNQKALQWWHLRQINRLHNGAELIRDGILQELFAVRRTLELAYEEHQPVAEDNLKQLEALHLKLEQVSNELSPAFGQDSLSLAIQHVLTRWHLHHPTIQLSTQLSYDPQLAPTLADRIALTTLEELLILISAQVNTDASLQVHLQCQDVMMLTLQINHLEPYQFRAIAQLNDLNYLCNAFEFLTMGQFHQTLNSSSIQWQLNWAVSTKPKS